MGKVLIVEDLEDMRFTLSNVVKKEKHGVFATATGEEALEIMKGQIIDLVFLDIGLPDINGISLIGKIKDIAPDVDIVMLTGMDDAKSAVSSLKAGAIDYILKPFDIVEFRNILQRVMAGRLSLKQSMLEGYSLGIDSIIGENKEIVWVKKEIGMAAEVKSPVLIIGETGTGKELVARAIYNLPDKKSGVFVKVDCGTLSANIIESELFGYRKGAFTDAKTDKKGLVELADGGTLFLDEIGNLPVELQPKILRLIEEGTFRKVGGVEDMNVDVRIIAATNKDLEKEVKEGTFREDLFFRLKVILIAIPPLRNRGHDITILLNNYMKYFSHELKKPVKGISPEAEKLCLNYSWPGNVRELKNCIERAVIYSRDGLIIPDNLNIRSAASSGVHRDDTLMTLEDMERRYIQKVLSSVNNNKTKAAKILAISRTTLREKLKTDDS